MDSGETGSASSSALTDLTETTLMNEAAPRRLSSRPRSRGVSKRPRRHLTTQASVANARSRGVDSGRSTHKLHNGSMSSPGRVRVHDALEHLL